MKKWQWIPVLCLILMGMIIIIPAIYKNEKLAQCIDEGHEFIYDGIVDENIYWIDIRWKCRNCGYTKTLSATRAQRDAWDIVTTYDPNIDLGDYISFTSVKWE